MPSQTSDDKRGDWQTMSSRSGNFSVDTLLYDNDAGITINLFLLASRRGLSFLIRLILRHRLLEHFQQLMRLAQLSIEDSLSFGYTTVIGVELAVLS
jgi:hypothetical protein